ncbi:MAG: transcription termination factor NusA [Aggregatilineales bacterium]
MAKSEFLLALNEISELRKLSRDVIAEALEQALISAYRRDSHAINAQRVEAQIDLVTNQHRILIEKEVVEDGDEDQTLIPIERALQVDPNTHIGEMLMVPIEDTVERFGRIAAQTAKQVISQKIREAERTQLYDEFKQREGELASAQIQSVTPSHITLTIDRAEANMPRKEMIPGERYRTHDKIRVLISEVKKSSREPAITVSRANKNMLRRLLEYEVPEIYNKQVEIKSIAREAGHRSKVAVAALQPGVDPLGACVGPRGMRIQNIVRELNDEKIDVIPWSADQGVFIQKALSPAQVSSVFLEEDIDQGKTALVIVPDNQLSLAIGREGQNARLAAKLTGWRIDIKSVSDAAFELLPHLDDPTLAKFVTDHADVMTEARRIIEKKRADRTVMPEEYATLGRFVQMVEQKLLDQRNAGRVGRHKAMDKIRSTVPAFAFKVPLSELNLPDKVLTALKNVDNFGDLILHFQADTEKLQAVLDAAKADEDTLTIIDEAIQDRLNLEAKKVAAAQAEPTPVEIAPVLAEVAQPAEAVEIEPEDAEELPPAFVDIAPKTPVTEDKPRFRKVARPLPGTGTAATPEAAGAPDSESKKGKDKKDKGRFRELVFDEDRGQVVAKRKHKDGRGTPGWFDEEDDI